MARDDSSEATVKEILDAQATRVQRLAAADDVIVNNGSIDAMRESVSTLHAKYKALAARLRAVQQQ